MNMNRRCTCWCEVCWQRRDECTCSTGPTGLASSQCEVHSDVVVTVDQATAGLCRCGHPNCSDAASWVALERQTK